MLTAVQEYGAAGVGGDEVIAADNAAAKNTIVRTNWIAATFIALYDLILSSTGNANDSRLLLVSLQCCLLNMLRCVKC